MSSGKSWTERLFRCYVSLGSPDAAPAWHWSQWQQIARELEPLLVSARGPVATYSSQWFANSRKKVPLGRMGWTEKAHSKWTHGSPDGIDKTGWDFCDAEVWAPSKTICSKEGQPPDIFLGLRNEGFGDSASLIFNPVVLLAVAFDLNSEERSLTASARIADTMQAKLHASILRPWARVRGKGLMSDCLNDLLVSGLFKPGPRHKLELSVAIFEDSWQSV